MIIVYVLLKWFLAVFLAALFPVLALPMMVWRDRYFLLAEWLEIVKYVFKPWRVE